MCAYSFFLSEIIGDIATEMSQFLYFYFLLWLISVVLIVCRFCHWSSFVCRGRLWAKRGIMYKNDLSNVYIINALNSTALWIIFYRTDSINMTWINFTISQHDVAQAAWSTDCAERCAIGRSRVTGLLHIGYHCLPCRTVDHWVNFLLTIIVHCLQ